MFGLTLNWTFLLYRVEYCQIWIFWLKKQHIFSVFVERWWCIVNQEWQFQQWWAGQVHTLSRPHSSVVDQPTTHLGWGSQKSQSGAVWATKRFGLYNASSRWALNLSMWCHLGKPDFWGTKRTCSDQTPHILCRVWSEPVLFVTWAFAESTFLALCTV